MVFLYIAEILKIQDENWEGVGWFFPWLRETMSLGTGIQNSVACSSLCLIFGQKVAFVTFTARNLKV